MKGAEMKRTRNGSRRVLTDTRTLADTLQDGQACTPAKIREMHKRRKIAVGPLPLDPLLGQADHAKRLPFMRVCKATA